MYAEDPRVDNGCERQVIKDFCAVAPDVYATILSEALIVKTVHLGDLTRLVIASNQSDALGVPDLLKTNLG